jgi:type II restriction enzyme
LILNLDIAISESYKSNTQKIRVMSESWAGKNLYCPSCLSEYLSGFNNNNPIGDFYCEKCLEQFELKSKLGVFGSKIVDGAYHKMIERISSSQNPNFLFLSYNKVYGINDLFLIPKHFFIPDIIEKRNPLSESARRSGWIGCNINLSKLPQLGKIPIIHKSTIIDKNIVRSKWLNAFKLRKEVNSSKGWIFDILTLIENLSTDNFSLIDIYNYDIVLSSKYPENNNVRPKIRQQLQKLRDLGYVKFLGNGQYLRIKY